MATTKMGEPVAVRLNQQQLELVDATIAKGVAPNREELFRLALREYCQEHHAGLAKRPDTRTGKDRS